ncbi:LegC family aminotransferase [Fretibacter rubidus]|uniref:LegC family aminotransferase n=1 Tax=Fretibacter rubidus TaxID=570162 RepID=UPI00352AB655
MTQKTDDLIAFVRSLYGDEFIPLHRPVFNGRERDYLVRAVDSNFVSSVGVEVNRFEDMVADYTGAKYAISCVNGTAALHVSLILAGVEQGDEVLSQPLTFIATCNAISYTKAKPVFIDVDRDTMGMSPSSLQAWLTANTHQKDGHCVNKNTGAVVRACVPMHTFGLPLRIKEIADICKAHNIVLIEDAAESLGSWVGDTHTGNFGALATLSFNGNKVITTGGGGMILTNDEALAKRAKHMTTTSKIPHPYEFVHDEVGFNYRMPALNAALGCAQMEMLPQMQAIKATIAKQYQDYCAKNDWNYVHPLPGTKANYWLNALCLDDLATREAFLKQTNTAGVMTRPVWRLMNELEMFKDCEHDGVANAKWLEARIVNIPSSVPDAQIESLTL